ncbi:MAG: hypothetical protein ACRC30_10915 [Clostridium sp.]
MNKEELIERLKEGQYCYTIKDLFIRGKVEEILEAGETLTIFFETGDVTVSIDNIKKERFNEKLFEWSYALTSKKGEYLGSIHKRINQI